MNIGSSFLNDDIYNNISTLKQYHHPGEINNETWKENTNCSRHQSIPQMTIRHRSIHCFKVSWTYFRLLHHKRKDKWQINGGRDDYDHNISIIFVLPISVNIHSVKILFLFPHFLLYGLLKMLPSFRCETKPWRDGSPSVFAAWASSNETMSLVLEAFCF